MFSCEDLSEHRCLLVCFFCSIVPFSPLFASFFFFFSFSFVSVCIICIITPNLTFVLLSLFFAFYVCVSVYVFVVVSSPVFFLFRFADILSVIYVVLVNIFHSVGGYCGIFMCERYFS